ncbi:MAG: hypothetical protein CSA26_04620 [Desulfobacterales bacterium]|nr:MAG: hypothetical protein CSA26_04620 [Desulfobacterales bacterium]
MPQKTDEQKAARKAKMQAGLKTAIQVPLKTMTVADEAWDAYQNVLINLPGIEDESIKKEIFTEAETLVHRASQKIR